MKGTTQNNIGKILTEGERDAIHIAVLPAIAHIELSPGSNIGFKNGETCYDNLIGIVDPFLTKGVRAGEMFYIFLYPNSITSLRHLWTHPDILDSVPTEQSKGESEAWLRNWIENADCPDYDTVMAALQELPLPDNEDVHYSIQDYEDGPTLFFHNTDAHSDIPSEFWRHFEIVTGKKVPIDERVVGFSCSC